VLERIKSPDQPARLVAASTLNQQQQEVENRIFHVYAISYQSKKQASEADDRRRVKGA